ncbi:NUDIX domain-containing protein [Streptomyces sp. NPDC090994]|uniref:NUDIX domain-containing protein n=1 Tax=Streptomyces sp. NPDC090994 TaxID=3365969 RepID=UPI00382A2EB7
MPRQTVTTTEARPPIVALCGSTRHWDALAEANLYETAAGRIVLAPGCNLRQPHPLWADPNRAGRLKQQLGELHRRKIDLADEVLVVNPDGYIGDSTRSEIDYAQSLGKPVRYTHTPDTTRYTADVVVLTPDGRVLLIERDWPPYEGAWALPGGHVDPGESSREAAARELDEETGLHVTVGDLRPIGTWDKPGRDPRGRYSTDAYLAVVPADTQITAHGDARTARWWPLNHLPDRLAFDHADILNTAVAPSS